MPKAVKDHSPAGSAPDTPSSPRLPENKGNVDVMKQGTKIPNQGNRNVITKMNQGIHYTNSNPGNSKRKRY